MSNSPGFDMTSRLSYILLDISNNQKSNQLSGRNHQLFPSTPYSLLPTPYSLLPNNSKILTSEIYFKFINQSISNFLLHRIDIRISKSSIAHPIN